MESKNILFISNVAWGVLLCMLVLILFNQAGVFGLLLTVFLCGNKTPHFFLGILVGTVFRCSRCFSCLYFFSLGHFYSAKSLFVVVFFYVINVKESFNCVPL